MTERKNPQKQLLWGILKIYNEWHHMFQMEIDECMRRRMRRFNRRNACVDASMTMRRSGLWVKEKEPRFLEFITQM